ncbi:hypothetical protein XBO1_2400011 [Xenorhabdus bovienii str. oregonense]|uniref:Uncharacterized protein n=1 Tax=Xenorhabdus bovienii str. oregonense TaxID=1398202 RepID=A0A077P6K2_XENBV|nr:hypothetical protein XBO1_2400011 [Xenorhabdus bovienii str. oregonense]
MIVANWLNFYLDRKIVGYCAAAVGHDQAVRAIGQGEPDGLVTTVLMFKHGSCLFLVVGHLRF